MKKNKKGFTLAEVLICMVIVGFIMVVAVNAIRIVKASYTSLTYFTFKNLKDMVGTVYSGQTAYTLANAGDKTAQKQHQQQSDKPYMVRTEVASESSSSVSGYEQLTDSQGRAIQNPTTYCRYDADGEYSMLSVLKNDKEDEYKKPMDDCTNRTGTKTGAGDDEILFCHALSGILNSSGTVRCKYSYLRQVQFNSSNKEPYISDLVDPNSPNRAIKKDIDPNFVTTNGQRYFLSQWMPPKTGEVSKKYGYRVLAVDLNGKTGPNRLDESATGRTYSSNPPDIVQFLILDNGQVYPLGLAADNMAYGTGNDKKRVQYLTTQIKGYYFDSENVSGREDVNIPVECKKLKAKDYEKNDDGTFKEGSDGKFKEEEVNACNFGRVDISRKEVLADGKEHEHSFFTYREAYCAATPEENVEYKKYCGTTSNPGAYNNTYSKSPYCPPLNKATDEGKKGFDECRVVNIKPMFRYNFK